jgi:hypothetical protein
MKCDDVTPLIDDSHAINFLAKFLRSDDEGVEKIVTNF